MTDVKKCVLDTVARHRRKGSSTDLAALNPEASLIDEGVLDSVGFINLVLELETLVASGVGLGDIDPHEHTSINGLVRFFSRQ